MKTIKCFNQSIKFGDTITLTASGGIDYLWNTGTTTASMDVSPDSSAIYYVTDTNGCVNFDDVTILVGSSHNAGGVIMSEIGRGMVFIPVFSNLSKPTLTNQELFDRRVMELCPIDPSYPNNGGLMRINGNIITKDVEATMTGWWDKVFEKEYHLMPLDSLEAFLFTYKHLPEIPCENEVTEEGLKLGEFNALLLRKIEELTLYVIELNNENKILRERSNVIEVNKNK